jgi:hypothetical protein
MLGVREKTLVPGKEFAVRWGDTTFPTMSFLEEFETLNPSVKPVAFAENGEPIAYESSYKRGRVIILGSFAGQQNQQQPLAMHPLGGILAQWAGLTVVKLQAPELLEVRQMTSAVGRFVFFFNHTKSAAHVEFQRQLERPAASINEIISGQKVTSAGTDFRVKADVPAESLRIYRIDY